MNCSESTIPEPTKISTSAPRKIRALITLETNGEFLLNVTQVLQATGMTLEELFEYLSHSVALLRQDRFPDSLMFNSRYPKRDISEINHQLSTFIDHLRDQTGLIDQQAESIRLMGVCPDEDTAYVEITPLPNQ